jgi:methyl-accepting chemotaxis protein
MKIIGGSSIRAKMIIGYMIMIIFLVVCGATGFFGIKKVNTNLNKIFAERLPAIDYLLEADRDFHQVIIAERALVFTDLNDEKFEIFVKDYNNSVKKLIDHFNKFKALADTAEAKKLIKEYERNFSAWKKVSTEIATLAQDSSGASKIDALDMSFGEGIVLFEKAREGISKLSKLNLQYADQDQSQAQKAYKTSSLTFIIMVAAGVIIGLLIGLKLSSNITNNINNVSNMLKEISEGEGDLTKKLPVESNDEIGRLARYFNLFLDNLHQIISTVKVSSENVTKGSSQLAETSESLAANFHQQAVEVSSVASSTEEMSVSASEVMKSLTEVSAKAEQASDNTTEGKLMLADAVATVLQIKEKVETLGGTVDQLSNSSTEIGNILSVINDIADQTNLLALNAAIEAARAGEQGRGFAVVADEVRKLAERSQDAIKEIESIIGNLQRESSVASTNMHDASEKVNEGVESIRNTEEMFENIVDSVNIITDANRIIGSSIEEQSTAIHAINENTQSISTGIESSSGSIHEVATTLSGLRDQTEHLSDLVKRFKT